MAKHSLVYVGDGSFIPGVPAEDHDVDTATEATRLVGTGLYKRKAAPKKRKAKKTTTPKVAAETPADAPQIDDTTPAAGEGA